MDRLTRAVAVVAGGVAAVAAGPREAGGQGAGRIKQGAGRAPPRAVQQELQKRKQRRAVSPRDATRRVRRAGGRASLAWRDGKPGKKIRGVARLLRRG